MYKYISALCLAKQLDAQWKSVDISTFGVNSLYTDYIKVILTLTNPFIEGDIYVDMEVLRERFNGYTGTIQELLDSLGNEFIQSISSLPNKSTRYVTYSDAFYAGYHVDTTLIGQNTTNLLPTEKKDLVMTRPDYKTDMSLLHTHALITINGYLHRTDCEIDGSKAYVVDGRYSLQKSKQNQVGILNFYKVGKIVKESIKESNIYSLPNGALKDRTYINVETDLTNKTVLLSLGGYLVLPQDGVFWQSGNQTVALNLSALPMLERLFESSNYLDLSSLGLSINSKNQEIKNAQEFFTDSVLKKYMMLSQSFLIIVDTPLIFSEKYYLKHCNLPGMFTAYSEPTCPLFVGYGRMVEYWKTEEDTHWSVTVQDSFVRDYIFTYRPESELSNITPNAIPNREFKHSQGLLLQIGTYK